MYCELVPGKATFLRLPPRRRSPQMHQQSTSNPIGKQKAKWSQVRVDERYMLMRLKSATGNTSSILLRVAYPKEITFFEVKVEVWPGLWHVCHIHTISTFAYDSHNVQKWSVANAFSIPAHQSIPLQQFMAIDIAVAHIQYPIWLTPYPNNGEFNREVQCGSAHRVTILVCRLATPGSVGTDMFYMQPSFIILCADKYILGRCRCAHIQ